MPDVSGPGDSTPADRPHLPPTAGLDGPKYRTAAEAALEPESPAAHGSDGVSSRCTRWRTSAPPWCSSRPCWSPWH
jgi:hypothetical protein